MLKQFTSIVFLLLANIILLAHDVIPHHHHENDICFEHHNCEDSHSHESETPHPPSEDDDSCCLLAEMVVFTPSTQSFKKICPCCENDHKLNTIEFSFIPTYAFTGFILFDQFPFRRNPYRKPSLLSPADQIHGLRAPPMA